MSPKRNLREARRIAAYCKKALFDYLFDYYEHQRGSLLGEGGGECGKTLSI